MAILKDGDDTYEVRIKRYPDGTHFDEHIKVEEREKPNAKECTRYIIGEAGMRYTIEIKLHKGFDFGEYDRVQAQLYFPGITRSICHLDVFKPSGVTGRTTEDLAKQMEYADVNVGGRKMLGTRFAFRGLAADESLKKSTDIMGIDPESLGYFRVSLFRLRWETKTLSAAEHRQLSQAQQTQLLAGLATPLATFNESKKLWDAKKVDEDSFSKDGLTCAVGFVGGKPEISRTSWTLSRFSCPTNKKDVPRIKSISYEGSKMNIFFRYRSSDFIERTGIVAYPPPLYLYTWSDLAENERKTALKELQAINKDHIHQAREAKSGAIIAKYGKGRKIEEPKEWRAWSKMYGWERELAFDTLKKAKRAHERGEVQRQFENNRGDIISLIDDEPEDAARSKSKKRAVEIVEDNDSEDDAPKAKTKLKLNSSVDETGTEESKVKDEPIDVDAPPAKKLKVEQGPAIAENGSDDEELRKKRERARKLAEDIEAEERLARMKREQRALEAEIEAAEKKKKRSSKN